MTKKLVAAGSSVAVFLASAVSAFAQELPPINVQPVEDGGVRITDVGQLISSFVGAALLISGLLVFGYLVLGGIQWITSGGDKGKIESARNKITNALIGLAIVAASYAVMQVIGFFFGVNIFGTGLQEGLQNIRPY